MKAPIALLGKVNDEGTKWEPNSPNAFKVSFIGLKGKMCWVIIEEYKEIHSDAQRAYWWGVVIEKFREAMGYERREARAVHEWVLCAIGHCKEVVNKLTGEVEKIAHRTRRLPKDIYSRNIDEAQRLGAEYGIVIPDPNTEDAQSMITAWKRNTNPEYARI